MKRPAVLEPAEIPSTVRAADETALVRPLGEATNEREVGGKASNLARLIALGAPVPAGIVIVRAAFDRFLEVNGLLDRIEPLCIELNATDPDRFRQVSEAIRALITSTPLPPSVQRSIESIARDLPPDRVLAVRSSAVGEDAAHASFAGQLDSILGVTTMAELEQAVLACWASYWSERALFYRTARRVTLDGMGVIVQRQVPACVSGVLFTRDPGGTAGAKTDDLVIEYCAGLGDALVSGRVDPGRLIVSRADRSVREVAALAGRDGGENVGAVLTPRRILDLARLALRLEQELGKPQDIEWAIDDEGRLWILQARPITTVPSDPERHEATVLWSNANVNENFPQPISPLLYSIASVGYYHYFRNLGLAFGVSRRRLAAMESSLRAIIGVHGARMYYNLTSIHAILRMAPFGDRLTSAFNQFVGATETAARPPGAPGGGDRRGRLAQLLEILRIATQTTWQYLFLRRRVESFERTADAFAERTRPDKLSDRSLAELLEDFHVFLDIRCHRWKNASLADAASMVCYALLQRALAGTGGSVALHNRLLRALPGVPSSIPPLRLWELSRMIRSDEPLQRLFASADSGDVLDVIRRDGRFTAFRQAFDRYLEDWGFRSSGELMLTVPSLQENPAPVIDLLKGYAASEGEPPEAAISRQAAERLAETSQLLRRLARRAPIKAAAVWLLLRWTQRAVVYRERVRLKQALLYGRCRHLALALGERLASAGILREPDEVFMLTWQEIDELGSGRSMFPYNTSDLISLRGRAHAALAGMCPPDTIRLPEGRYVSLGYAPPYARPNETGDPANTSVVLQGTGACGGLVTARAAVLADVRDAAHLHRGEVLVTRQTDPGWAPVFCLISGLVIERGGMLSHGAILAREFGLPCVVGIQDATRRITHGALVTVDGDLGTCAIGRKTSAGSSLEPDTHGGTS